MNIFGELHRDWEHATRQHDQQGDTMHITDLAADIRDHLEQGQAWLTKVVEDKLPALLEESARLARSPIAQVLEEIGNVVLPPETEQAIVALIRFAASASTPAVAAGDGTTPAEPERQPADADPGQAAGTTQPA